MLLEDGLTEWVDFAERVFDGSEYPVCGEGKSSDAGEEVDVL